jgi:hypothetical protein
MESYKASSVGKLIQKEKEWPGTNELAAEQCGGTPEAGTHQTFK